MAKKGRAKFVYMENGYMIGLPARTMTEEEWLSCPKELTKPALTQKLYAAVREEELENEAKDA